MRYYSNEQLTDLNALQDRLQGTDLIPSQEPLLEGMAENISALRKVGVQSLADLRAALKTAKSLATLAEKSGVDTSYLQLLRRVINGFFPKPRPLKEINWLGKDLPAAFSKIGIKNTKELFEAASNGVASLSKRTGLDQKVVLEFIAISNLCRIQWVSPTFARALVAAGCSNAAAVAAKNPEALAQKIAKANENAKLYKGKVGLRDVKRLVAAAAYVP